MTNTQGEINMAYSHVVKMAESASLLKRIAACAARKNTPDPQSWAAQNIWHIVSYDSQWEQLWEYYTIAPQFTENVNPDAGARTDVITDAMIESIVNIVKA